MILDPTKDLSEVPLRLKKQQHYGLKVMLNFESPTSSKVNVKFGNNLISFSSSISLYQG